MRHINKKIFAYSIASAVSAFSIFLYILFTYSWWGIIETGLESSGQYMTMETISKYWVDFLLIMSASFLVILLHTTVIDQAIGKLGQWRSINAPVTYPIALLIALILFRNEFQFNQDFRTPPDSIGALSPPKIYIFTACIAYLTVILVSAIIHSTRWVCKLMGATNG
jgi:hypothetical protein